MNNSTRANLLAAVELGDLATLQRFVDDYNALQASQPTQGKPLHRKLRQAMQMAIEYGDIKELQELLQLEQRGILRDEDGLTATSRRQSVHCFVKLQVELLAMAFARKATGDIKDQALLQDFKRQIGRYHAEQFGGYPTTLTQLEAKSNWLADELLWLTQGDRLPVYIKVPVVS